MGRPGSLQTLRASNLYTLLTLIWDRSPISRPELASASGLGTSSVTRLTDDLAQAGLIRETGKGRSSGGRQPQLIEADGRAGYVIGIDLSAAALRASIFDTAGERLEAVTEPYVGFGAASIVPQIDRVIVRLKRKRGRGRTLLGIGLSIPGTVEPVSGDIIAASSLHVTDLPLARMLTERFGVPVVTAHDAAVAVLAERMWGSGEGSDDLVYVLVAKGIGSGILLGGRVHPGSSGRSGQLGHVIVRPGGRFCVCGQRGCLEAVGAGPAMAEDARVAIANDLVAWPDVSPSLPDDAMVSILVARAEAGDPLAASILRSSAEALAHGVATVARLLDVERVIVGGEAVENSPLYLDHLRATVEGYLGPSAQGLLRPGSLRHADHIRALGRLTIERSVRRLLDARSAA